MKYWQPSRGFTLMELMIVVGIIGMLLAALAFPLSAAREKARDRSRLADLGQIEFALAAYVNKYGTVIDCDDGLKIDGSNTVFSMQTNADVSNGGCDAAVGQQILDFMQDFLGSIPADPKGPGDPDYYYYFDPAHACLAGSVDAPLLFAANLETEGTNRDKVCAEVNGEQGGYMFHEPYVQVIDFSE